MRSWTQLGLTERSTRSLNSRISLNQRPHNQIGARLWNITDYYILPVLTLVLSGIYLLLLVYLGCTANQKNSPFEYLLRLLVKSRLLCFLGLLQFWMQMLKDHGVFIAE